MMSLLLTRLRPGVNTGLPSPGISTRPTTYLRRPGSARNGIERMHRCCGGTQLLTLEPKTIESTVRDAKTLHEDKY